MYELFELLDADCSGKVDLAEFCDGILGLVTSDSPVDTQRLMAQLHLVRGEVDVQMRSMHAQIKQVLERLEPRGEPSPRPWDGDPERLSRMRST